MIVSANALSPDKFSTTIKITTDKLIYKVSQRGQYSVSLLNVGQEKMK